MKTLAKTKREPGIWMVDGPVPEVGHNDVMIKIRTLRAIDWGSLRRSRGRRRLTA